MSAETVLTQYTVYCRPIEAPEHYVVRQWDVVRGEVEPVPGEASLHDTLDEARAAIPAGMYCLGRSPSDDPSIVETWT